MSVVKSGEMGHVTAQDIRQLVVDVNVSNPAGIPAETTEVILRVNGRIVSRMHPERARRMGLVEFTERY